MKAKVLIEIEGGSITSIRSTRNLEIHIIDWDRRDEAGPADKWEPDFWPSEAWFQLDFNQMLEDRKKAFRETLPKGEED